MLLFLTTNMTAVTSRANQQFEILTEELKDRQAFGKHCFNPLKNKKNSY